ncbi:MAG: hypothetical protein HQL06_05590 [Nitrospirae bacterium]|nr:hypothetical protein [Nitrospirota bacterium]
MRRYLVHIWMAALMPLLLSCTDSALGSNKNAAEFKKEPALTQTVPKKPVHIKLKRNFKGEYSWDLSGDNVKEMLRINAELQKELPAN